MTETKQCQNCRNSFVIEPEDNAFLERFDIPPSAQCPQCVWQHLLAFWIFGKFRKTQSDLSGKRIITTLPESAQFPIYAYEEWISDAWDALSYGLEYDYNRSFFDQLIELQKKVPHPHRSGTNNVRCEWCDDASDCKDCYLCRSLLECEYLTYGYRTMRCRNSIDLVFSFDMENSYDCTYCFKCYQVRHSFNARNCMDCMFLYDCRNCQNCFMCWNLRNKQYCILNQQYSKEDYFEKLKNFNSGSYKSLNNLKNEFWKNVASEAIHRADLNINAVSSSGNFLEECRGCHSCFFLQKSEKGRYILRGYEDKDVIYATGSIAEKAAWTTMDWSSYETAFTSHCVNCRYSWYLDYCENCEYCFGCVGLKNKQYYILNKQYGKGEYETLVAKIKEKMKQNGEWGKFFPLRMAYSGYNLSLANIYFPETEANVKQLGGKWDNVAEVHYEGVSGDDLPDTIQEIPEDFPEQAVICPKTKWRFNMAQHELEFYKRYNIPPPHYHPDFRTMERFKMLTAITPQKGNCHFCSVEIVHYYPPEWDYQKIACIDCYHKEVA